MKAVALWNPALAGCAGCRKRLRLGVEQAGGTVLLLEPSLGRPEEDLVGGEFMVVNPRGDPVIKVNMYAFSNYY